MARPKFRQTRSNKDIFKLEYQKAFNREFEKMKYNNTKFISERLCFVVAIVLHDEFGFGNQRIKQFMDAFDSQLECVVGDYVSYEDLHNWCKDRGIDIEFKRMGEDDKQ